MVLKYLVNEGDRDIELPWGQWRYKVPAKGQLMNPPADVITAMLDRYPFISVGVIEEPEVVEIVETPDIEDGVLDEKPKKKMGRPRKIKE